MFELSFDDTYIWLEDFGFDIKIKVQSLSENQWYIKEDSIFEVQSVDFEVQNEFLSLILKYTQDYWRLLMQAVLALADETLYRSLDIYNTNAFYKRSEA